MALTDDDKKWISTALDVRLANLATMEALRDVETTLLAEFHKWASPREMRQHAQTATLTAIEAELAELRERITKLEPKQ
jgi:hypothetical protein